MRTRVLIIAAAVACVVLGLLFPWIRTTAIVGICYGLAALGVAVLLRAGQISFGHAMYACISGYAVAFLARAFPQLDGLVLIAAGVAIAVVLSHGNNKPSARHAPAAAIVNMRVRIRSSSPAPR